MGKGDITTKKGKRHRGTNGVTRPKKSTIRKRKEEAGKAGKK
jgi:ribosomal small subunit protein bTHX